MAKIIIEYEEYKELLNQIKNKDEAIDSIKKGQVVRKNNHVHYGQLTTYYINMGLEFETIFNRLQEENKELKRLKDKKWYQFWN